MHSDLRYFESLSFIPTRSTVRAHQSPCDELWTTWIPFHIISSDPPGRCSTRRLRQLGWVTPCYTLPRRNFQSCISPDDIMILKLLEAEIQSFKAFLNRNRKLINWLRLVVYAVHTYLLFLMHSSPNRSFHFHFSTDSVTRFHCRGDNFTVARRSFPLLQLEPTFFVSPTGLPGHLKLQLVFIYFLCQITLPVLCSSPVHRRVPIITIRFHQLEIRSV